MDVYTKYVGTREFLVLGDVAMVPVDRIKAIDLNAPNGGARYSVRIITDDPSEDWIFANKNAEAIRDFLAKGT